MNKSPEMRAAHSATSLVVIEMQSEASLWQYKRQLQKRNLALLASGAARQEDMLLFTVEQVRNAKVLNGPY